MLPGSQDNVKIVYRVDPATGILKDKINRVSDNIKWELRNEKGVLVEDGEVNDVRKITRRKKVGKSNGSNGSKPAGKY